ncbi:acyl-CoA dehydrogenase domain-containing protein, partial [Salmonella enterica]|uniref:acyl-CoA dehydrogenase domain-containing protein n=1 Tax=Salmonella enterica TaxID=28901 RepID=UPI00398C7209
PAQKGYRPQRNWVGGNRGRILDVLKGVVGGRLKRGERRSGRLGDVLRKLYLASAVLKRYDDEGGHEADLPLVHWGVKDALYRPEQAMDDLLQNFPNRLVPGFLTAMIFPTGPHYRAASYNLDRALSKTHTGRTPT